MQLTKGQKVRVAGLAGEGVILDLVAMPGEQDRRVKVAFLRPRSGKVRGVRWVREKDVVAV